MLVFWNEFEWVWFFHQTLRNTAMRQIFFLSLQNNNNLRNFFFFIILYANKIQNSEAPWGRPMYFQSTRRHRGVLRKLHFETNIRFGKQNCSSTHRNLTVKKNKNIVSRFSKNTKHKSIRCFSENMRNFRIWNLNQFYTFERVGPFFFENIRNFEYETKTKIALSSEWAGLSEVTN